MVFAAARTVSCRLTAGTGKIGIRISSHPVAFSLARELGSPITATSANLSGEPENASASAVINSLGALSDAVVDSGETPGAPGSTILDVTVRPPRILREGRIAAIRILSALEIEPR
jgi:L-threonylcarbamoyladenylate synthase